MSDKEPGHFSFLVSSTVVLWYHRISKCKKGGTNGLKWAFERIYPDVNQAALCRPDIYRKEALRIPQEGSKAVDLPILLYETAPVQKVTGIIADWLILQASPEAVWTYSKTHSGLTADRFFGYYEGCDKAVAIRIYSVVPFKDSLELQTLNPELKRPPQSFCYVQSELDLPMKG